MRALDKAAWFKSSYSGASNGCVEVAVTHRVVGIRDTKNRSAHLSVNAAGWSTFLAALKNG